MGSYWKILPLTFFSWFLHLLVFVESGPLNLDGPSREVANNSLTEFDSAVSKGCRYKAIFYSNGEEVSTDEPCLACQCKGTVVVCKLRICPEIPVPPPPGCIVVHKAKSCCSQLICHIHGQELTKKISREQRFPLSVSNETLLASVSNESKDSGYCVLDGTVYAEGSAMRSSTLCQYCFCIRGEMKCSSPQCVIPLKGCKPRFRSYACCPTNYDCGQSNETAVLKTMPSSTQVPQFLKGCLVGGQFVPEGEPVLPVQISGFGNNTGATNVCQTCFCMGGVVHCQPLECDQPIDGCVPIKEDGHCCPDRYDCSSPQPVSSSTTARSAASPSSTSLSSTVFADVPATTSSTEGSSNEMAAEIATSTSEVTTTRSSETTTGVITIITLDNEDEADMTTANVNTDDSFERIAAVMTGSSEESSSIVPPQSLSKRVSATAIGGFKNRSDLGSREERRSKDGDELALRQSTEDDERDELVYPSFETTISNAIEDLGATTLFDELLYNPTTDSETDSFETEATPVSKESWRLDNVTENYGFEVDSLETTLASKDSDFNENDIGASDVETTSTISTNTEGETTPITSPSLVSSATSVSPSTDSEITSTTASNSPTSTLNSVELSKGTSTSTTGSLEFIPFVEEDALVNVENDTKKLNTDEIIEDFVKLSQPHLADNSPSGIIHEPIISLLKPLELKFVNGTEETLLSAGSHEVESALEDALPIIVEKDALAPFEPIQNFRYNISATLPVSTSLYNNGYYPHGDIIRDDGPPGELVVSEGEIIPKESKRVEDDEDDANASEEKEKVFTLNLNQGNDGLVEIKLSPSTVSPSTSVGTSRQPEQAIKVNTFNEKSALPFSLSTVQPVIDYTGVTNPSRTYSKFGMQDSPFYRFDHQGLPLPSTSLDNNGFVPNQQYHHRYYNEPEEIPQSRIQNPYNYYGHTGLSNSNRQKANQHGQSVGMLPPIYKNNNFFYEDASTGLDSYEDYETFANPPTSNGLSTSASPPTNYMSTSTPRSSTSLGPAIQFLGERVRLPSYNQQRATSTPKYKYAHKSTFQKKFTTERTTTPMSDYAHSFPFNLPKNQDNLYNLGIKLSGCNVVGKMYSVGEVIEELSSDCLRCMCSDIGVHCVELKCKK